jgi:hypothetical protein
MNRQSSETVAARRQLQKIEAEIRNCTRAIASDGLTSFLRTRMGSEAAELETQHRDLTEKLAASEPDHSCSIVTSCQGFFCPSRVNLCIT